MRRPALGDVVSRARGLATHLLDRATLHRLAHASGPGVLAGMLQDLGYWPAPSAGGAAVSAARVVERSIDYETEKRLALLLRWLGERAAPFVGLFDEPVRDAVRIRLRELASLGTATPPERSVSTPGWPALRDVRAALAGAADLPGLVRALARARSPYAQPLAAALRAGGPDPRALESALDRAWATRARAGAERRGGALVAWVEDEIDLENAWTALAGGGGDFVEGGRQLDRDRHARILRAAEPGERRRLLAATLRSGPLAGLLEDPDAPLSILEARARAVRIAASHRAARIDPIGPGAIVEVVQRLRAERADLRGIAWGVSQGLPHDAITAGLSVAT